MTKKDAIRILARYAPCAHENHRTDLGNGLIWARCEDCQLEFQRERLPDIRKAARLFAEAIDAIRPARKKAAK